MTPERKNEGRTQLTRSQVEELIYRLQGIKSGQNAREVIELSRKEILLGDVLESGEIQVQWTEEQRWEKEKEVLDLWRECGFNRSLQDIIEESGWESFCPYKNEDCPQCKKRLKSPEANELLSFLYNLFPNESTIEEIPQFKGTMEKLNNLFPPKGE